MVTESISESSQDEAGELEPLRQACEGLSDAWNGKGGSASNADMFVVRRGSRRFRANGEGNAGDTRSGCRGKVLCMFAVVLCMERPPLPCETSPSNSPSS
jgi:hypothetical protein